MNAAEMRRRLAALEASVAALGSAAADATVIVDRLAAHEGTPADVAALAPLVVDDLQLELMLRGIAYRHFRRTEGEDHVLWDAIDYAACIASYENPRHVPRDYIEHLKYSWRYAPKEWRKAVGYNPEGFFKLSFDGWARAALVAYAVDGDATCTSIRDAVDVFYGMSYQVQLGVIRNILHEPTVLLDPLTRVAGPAIFTKLRSVYRAMLREDLDNSGPCRT